LAFKGNSVVPKTTADSMSLDTALENKPTLQLEESVSAHDTSEMSPTEVDIPAVLRVSKLTTPRSSPAFWMTITNQGNWGFCN